MTSTDVPNRPSLGEAAAAAPPLGVLGILRRPLPEAPGFRERTALRLAALPGYRQVRAIHGLHNITPDQDPFLLALSHNIKREALMVPGLLMLHRNGRLVHFLADWNFMMIPGVGWIMRNARVITVSRKPAQPAFLDFLRPFYRGELPPSDMARRHLQSGRSVGVFPEGTVNRDPQNLLRGRAGMARLSLETGVPVIPAGIRFPDAPRDRPLAENEPLEVHIGAPLHPPSPTGSVPTLREAHAWHGEVMTAIGRLSGKTWNHGRRRSLVAEEPTGGDL